MRAIYTIGHSNQEPEAFLRLLRKAKIDVLVDVRSNPDSAWASFASRDNLRTLVASAQIKYVYMGDTLGGLPSDDDSYDSRTGRANYALMRERDSFRASVARLLRGAEKHRICLLCAEESPVRCHRSLLVGNALAKLGAAVLHIRSDGRMQTDEELLKERAGVPSNQATLPL